VIEAADAEGSSSWMQTQIGGELNTRGDSFAGGKVGGTKFVVGSGMRTA